MAKPALSGLKIRTAVVRKADLGYILASDPKIEQDEEATHTVFFKWNAGRFTKGSLNFSAHTCCMASIPEPALVMVAAMGSYGVTTKNAKLAGNIFKTGKPKPKKPRPGAVLRSVSEIGGKAYAVGLAGTVYRLDELTKWTRIDEGLSRRFNIDAIHGFSESEIYAVGEGGALWQFDGQNWIQGDLPTNAYLSSVKCAEDGTVYIAGDGGMLIQGRENLWQIVSDEEMTEDIWDLEWFKGNLYISTMSGVYHLRNGKLEPVDFAKDSPKTCYQLSTADGVMWSNGAVDVMSFDGKKWTRVV